jgi:hypothetical protein
MKKGQMLIFLATQKAHGSPVIEGDDVDGERAAVVFKHVLC